MAEQLENGPHIPIFSFFWSIFRRFFPILWGRRQNLYTFSYVPKRLSRVWTRSRWPAPLQRGGGFFWAFFRESFKRVTCRLTIIDVSWFLTLSGIRQNQAESGIFRPFQARPGKIRHQQAAWTACSFPKQCLRAAHLPYPCHKVRSSSRAKTGDASIW